MRPVQRNGVTVRRLVDAVRFLVSGTRVMVRGTTSLLRFARTGELRERMRPWMRFPAVTDIPFDLLPGQGVRAVLFDLENTLIPPGGPFTDEARTVLDRVRELGMVPVIVSNAAGLWVGMTLDTENVAYVAPAHKPGKDAFVEACRRAGAKPSQAVFVGDQVITDVFGAQRAGIRAILLDPRWRTEATSAKFQRLVSHALLKVLRD